MTSPVMIQAIGRWKSNGVPSRFSLGASLNLLSVIGQERCAAIGWSPALTIWKLVVSRLEAGEQLYRERKKDKDQEILFIYLFIY